jgi:hypothetical protein
VDAYLRRIRASVFALFSWLWSKFMASFQKSNNPVHPQDSTNDEGTNPENKRPNPVPPEPNSPPTPTVKKKSRKCCCKCLPIATFVVEVLGLFGLFVYAGLTYEMWQESHKNFILDQRAWINTTDTPPELTTGRPVVSKIKFSNTGKTLARRVTFDFNTVILKASESPNLVIENTLHTIGFSPLIVPNNFGEFEVAKLSAPRQPEVLSEIQFDDLKYGRAYVAVFGQGIYYDTFDNKHWFRYCAWHAYHDALTVYPVRNCAAFNDTGDGDLPKN